MGAGDAGREVAAHYDELDFLYRRIWGEHLHHGLWRSGVETLQQAGRAMVEEVAGKLGRMPGGKVCDVGCAYGATGLLLEKLSEVEVTGITISAAQQQAAVVGARVIAGDWLENGFGDSAFDGVVAIESLAHMADAARAVAEMARVLKPGGRVVLACWLEETGLSWCERVLLLEPIRRQGRLDGMGSLADLHAVLDQAGFGEVETVDLTSEVERSWVESLRKGVSLLIGDPGFAGRVIGCLWRRPGLMLSFLQIRIAYRSGALRYAIVSASRA